MFEKNIQVGDAVYSLVGDDDYLANMGSIFEPHLVELLRALIGPEDIVADAGLEDLCF